jgi:hypothetical protein
MTSWLEWLEDEVKEIPSKLVDTVKREVSNAAGNLWDNVRTDVGNAINQVGSAITTKAAGTVAPAGRSPVTIPLSSNQLLLLVAALVAVVGFVIYKAVK